jgi:hypothetical protein
MTSLDSPRARVRTWRRALIALYTATALVVVLQRGILGPQHNVFKIFRQSFRHLVAGRNLYAPYPNEQGKAQDDLFKYSPTAALSFAPFALPPYSVALWWSRSARSLYYALTRVSNHSPRYCVGPHLSIFTVSSVLQQRGLPASSLAYAAIECRHQWRGVVAIVLGAAVKIFPLVA